MLIRFMDIRECNRGEARPWIGNTPCRPKTARLTLGRIGHYIVDGCRWA
jgi:hypothetical protein